MTIQSRTLVLAGLAGAALFGGVNSVCALGFRNPDQGARATGQGENKDEAVRDAQRKAVENGAGTVIYSHSQTKDFALVKDTVLSRAAGFIQSFEVLSGKEVEDGLICLLQNQD